MHPILRNILGLIAGAATGMVVNSAIVHLNGTLIPLPEGADVSTMEGLKESMALFGPQHFLMPFLGHAIGTLVGALVAGLIASGHRLILAMVIGGFFLAGGIAAVVMLGGPLWFKIADLGLAYLPMAWLGCRLAEAILPRLQKGG